MSSQIRPWRTCRSWSFAWVILALGLVGAACAPTGPRTSAPINAEPAAPRRTVAGILSVPPSIDPYVTPGITQPGQAGLHSLVHVGLSIVDDAGRLVPGLAEAVPSVENGSW